MNTSTRRLLGGLAIAAVLLVGQGGFVRAADPSASPASNPDNGPTGNELLSVQPSVLSLSAPAGGTSKAQLTVRAAADLDLTIKPQGLGQGTDGNMAAIPADKDTGKFSARSMVTATPASVQIKRGTQITVDVSVVVPADAGEGTRYAIVSITGMPHTPTGSANVGFGVELGVSTILKIANTPQTKTGEIKSIDVGKSLPGQVLPVNVSFLNTGNTHYGAIPNELLSTATLQDASGTELGSATANGNAMSVLPGFVRAVNLAMTPSKPLVDGARYHLEAGVGLKDGTIFDRKAIDFTWSGGEILKPSTAPLQMPPVAASSGTDAGMIALAAGLGAAAVLLLIFIVSRLRRRSKGSQGAAGQ
jgi:hypothetical protein